MMARQKARLPNRPPTTQSANLNVLNVFLKSPVSTHPAMRSVKKNELNGFYLRWSEGEPPREAITINNKRHNLLAEQWLCTAQLPNTLFLTRGKKMKRFALLVAPVVLCGLMITSAKAEHKQDIVDTAVAAGSFKTLAAALTAADLVDALKGDGPFTVFAPTDEAFAKLPEGTIPALLKDKDKLTAVLTYHVVPGKVMAADVVKLSSAKTLQGSAVHINADSGVKINSSNVVKADIETANGVIHVIDSVLLPPAKTSAKSSSCSSN